MKQLIGASFVLAILSSTALAQSTPQTFWNEAVTPTTVTNPNVNLAKFGGVELGLSFQSSVPGTITGLDFYKGTNETGTNVGNLWDATGQINLGTVTFTNETASGWQTANFATPIVIQPNTTYIISYHANADYAQSPIFKTALTVGSLTAPTTNGAYEYGKGGFVKPPATWMSGFNATWNYSVDPIFTPTPPPPPLVTPPNFASCDFNVPTTYNHVWYIDPVNGQTQNAMTTAGISLDPTVTPHQGDVNHPWKDVNALDNSIATVKALGYPLPLIPGAIIKGGDEVLLQNGTAAQYGTAAFGIGGYYYNTSGPYITIQPAPGATVTFAALTMGSVDYLAFNGINVQSAGKFPLLSIDTQAGKNVVFQNMNISTTDPATAQTWTQAQWAAASNGVSFKVGPCVSMTNSHIFDVATGVAYQGGTQINFTNNEIDHVSQDAMDLCGLDENISFNKIHDFPNAGVGDHIDAIQGVYCIPAIPTPQRIAINNNTIIWQLDPNLPFPTGSLIDGAIASGGMDNLQAENNQISWPNYTHGMSIDHCNNCMFENNTLANGFITLNGGNVNMIVKNNLVTGLDCMATDAAGVTMENNVLYLNGNGINTVCSGGQRITLVNGVPGKVLGNNLVDSGGLLSEITAANFSTFTFDFHLLSTAPARGAGMAVDFTPQVDSFGFPLNSPPDVGAVQFPN